MKSLKISLLLCLSLTQNINPIVSTKTLAAAPLAYVSAHQLIWGLKTLQRDDLAHGEKKARDYFGYCLTSAALAYLFLRKVN